jgi:two-component system, cell cycle response regulator
MMREMEARGTGLTLLEAARIVARGGDLETELNALARHALAASGARAAAIYLLDPIGGTLVPAAAAGVSANDLAAADSVAVVDGRALVARVAHERRPLTSGDPDTAPLLGAMSPGELIAIPLVASDENGLEDVEGVLLAAFAGEAPDPESSEDPLFALADLSAVAIRKARLAHALTERSEWIERLASTDPLTGLANSATFERMLELEIARATRLKSQLSVVVFDIDDMSGINSRGGASAGDNLLRRFASLLADQVRLVDTIGRLGGDEFGLIAPGGGGEVVAGRVRQAATQLRTPDGSALGVLSGVAVFPDDGASGPELVAAATAALETARA